MEGNRTPSAKPFFWRSSIRAFVQFLSNFAIGASIGTGRLIPRVVDGWTLAGEAAGVRAKKHPPHVRHMHPRKNFKGVREGTKRLTRKMKTTYWKHG